MVASIRGTNLRSVRIGPVTAPPPPPNVCNGGVIDASYPLYFDAFTGAANTQLNGLPGNKAIASSIWYDTSNIYSYTGNCALKYDYVNQPGNTTWISLEGASVVLNVTEFAFRVRIPQNSRFWMELQSFGTGAIRFDLGNDPGTDLDSLYFGVFDNANVYELDQDYPLNTYVDGNYHLYQVKVNGSNYVELLRDGVVLGTTPFTVPGYIPNFDYPYPYFRFDDQMDPGFPKNETWELNYIGIAGAIA